MRRFAPVAVVVAASLLGLAACRGGVKSGLRTRETAAASEPSAPVAPSPPPSPPPSLTPPVVRPQVWRIEYYKISDG